MITIGEYLGGQLNHLKARWWLTTRPDKKAADALFYLNRLARSDRANGSRATIYTLKNAAIRVFYQKGFCVHAAMDRQVMDCWACNGTGRDPWSDREHQCYKCDGTGIYKETLLVAFHFTIEGQNYIWHQPRESIAFPYTLSTDMVYDYAEAGDKELAFDDPDVDLHIAVLWEYLKGAGVSEADLSARWTFRSLLKSTGWYWTWKRRLWNLRRLKVYLNDGYFPEDERDLPF